MVSTSDNSNMIPGIHNARQTDKNTIIEVIVLQLYKYLVIRKMSQYP